MKARVFVIAALAAAGFMASASVAQADGINQRERRQRYRIAEGVRRGDLTPREARRLRAQQRRFHLNEWRFRHSGRGLTPRERLRLHRQLDRSSRQIFRQRHDWRYR